MTDSVPAIDESTLRDLFDADRGWSQRIEGGDEMVHVAVASNPPETLLGAALLRRRRTGAFGPLGSLWGGFWERRSEEVSDPSKAWWREVARRGADRAERQY